MSEYSFPLSQIYIDFINTTQNVYAEFLEGTTASGKTTVGAVKFMRMVSASSKKMHVIASKTVGIAEKNIIQQDNGILDVHKPAVYFGNGDKNTKLPHIKFEGKIIYIFGYGDKSKWQLGLGSQFGCVFIDEINTSDIEFVREISTRNEYLLATLNPDAPNLPVYREFINRARPYQKYKKNVPDSILEELTEEATPGWRYWFFTFRDNLSLSEEDIKRKILSAPKGTKYYKNKILGLRGKATGVILNLERDNIINYKKAKEFTYKRFAIGVDTAYSETTPDKIALVFSGITTCRKKITLDCKVINNRERERPITPSDLPIIIEEFANINKEKWGFARDIYIDNADAGSVLECKKYKSVHGSIYNFLPAWKGLKVIDRLQLMQAWLAHGDYLVLDTCREEIDEMNIYSWKEDKYEPEDGNDHTINADQYSWLPFKGEIGK